MSIGIAWVSFRFGVHGGGGLSELVRPYDGLECQPGQTSADASGECDRAGNVGEYRRVAEPCEHYAVVRPPQPTR